MIRTKLFQKYFLLASSLLILFLILGFFFNLFLVKSILPRREMLPPIFIAKIVDRINPSDKVAALKELASWQENDGPHPRFMLLDENGKIIFSQDPRAEFKWDWSTIQKPERAYEFVRLEDLGERRGGPPGPPGFFRMPLGGPGGGPGPGGMAPALIRLNGNVPQFLLVGPPSPPMKDDRNSFFPFLGLICLVISLLLGVGSTIAIIYSSVSKSVVRADAVISELQSGNLKARFEVQRKDEFGQAMMRFNVMADEIEKLVMNMKLVEQARTKLLQELAHDLRTPIASLKNLLETLDGNRAKLDPKVQQELTTLSLKEIDYFERLVEDLLFLAQVREPAYQADEKTVSLQGLLVEEAEDCSLRYEHNGKKIGLVEDFEIAMPKMRGDAYLLRRLFRNALENAFSFARSEVQLQIKMTDPKTIRIVVQDNGPGLSHEGLEAFGHRRVTRTLDHQPGGRVSVGLGSVVMKTICEAHRGQIQISNSVDATGRVLGARLEITLSV